MSGSSDPTTFTYFTTHRVIVDGKDLPEGSEFKHSDPAIIAQLRAHGAIALREELMRPEAIAAQQADLMAQNAALLAELEALKAAGVSESASAPAAPAAPSSKASKSAAAADESK